MMRAFDLNLFEPILQGAGFVANLSARGPWRRSIRSMGGFWQGSITFAGDAGDLAGPFNEWLGYHLVERSAGSKTWEGMIYEMELTHAGSRRRRSLDLMANAVRVRYGDQGEVSTTAWATQTDAIARYGRKEENLSIEAPQSTAAALRARYLAGNAWPWARPVALGGAGQTVLEIRACGYVFTAQWMHVQAGSGVEDDLDHWILKIVGEDYGISTGHGGTEIGPGDCQFLKAGNLASNTLQVKELADSDTRPWSKIEELAGLGDSSGQPWRAWVDLGRVLHYQPIDLEPRYYMRSGGIYDTAGGRVAVNPWAMRPAVVRDLSYPVRRSEPGSSLSDARDQFVEGIEIGADGSISLTTALFDEVAILMAQAELGGETE